MQWMMNKIPISWYIYSCLAMRQRESFSAFSGFSMPALERASGVIPEYDNGMRCIFADVWVLCELLFWKFP